MIQIDIEMPKSCADCPLCHCKGKDDPWNYYCSITMDDINIEEWDNIRYNTCPLKEVPTELLVEPCEDTISRQSVIDAFHTWFRDGFDEDRPWNSTHVLAAVEGTPPVHQKHKWETCLNVRCHMDAFTRTL